MKTENIIIEEQEYGFKGWWHRNKNKVLIVGGVIVVSGICFVVYRNLDAIKGLFAIVKPDVIVSKNHQRITNLKVPASKFLPETTVGTTKIINNGEAFDVNGYIRTLPSGWKASHQKIAEAAERGITLMEKQTLVDSYTKNIA